MLHSETIKTRNDHSEKNISKFKVAGTFRV